MLRILIIIVLAGVAAYFTKPTEPQMEAKARETVEAPHNTEGGGNIIDDVVGTIKGWRAGDGTFEDFYVAAKYSADMPGSDYVECWGAFTLVRCDIKDD